MRRRRDPHTRDLFATPEPVSVGFPAEITGHGDVSSKIAHVVKHALHEAREEFGLKRDAVAEGMSKSLGRTVSAETLDKWSSEASSGHRITLDAFIALIEATKAYEALGFIPMMFGYAVVEERYVDVIQLKQIEDHQALLDARKLTLQARLRARS